MTTNADILSLTLPKATDRARIRFNKPKKPDFWALILGFVALQDAVYAVLRFLVGAYVTAGCDLILACLYWRAACLYQEKRYAKGAIYMLTGVCFGFATNFMPFKWGVQ